MVISKLKKTVFKRKPGRPIGSDATLRDCALDCALRKFAEVGIAHTTLREVALQSNTTPALMNYYFGDKNGLIKAVINERVQRVISEIQNELKKHTESNLDALKNLMLAFVNAANINPLVPKLVLREVYSEQGLLRDTFMSGYGQLIAYKLLELISKAQVKGEIRSDLDAKRVAFAFMSLTIYPVLAFPFVPTMLGFSKEPNCLIEQANHNFAIFLQGVS